MKKLIIAFGFLVLLSVGVRAQEHKDGLYSVAFYNLENLFDTIHDAGKNDYEYLPDAAKGWNSEKYHSKLKKLSKVLGELSRDKVPAGPAAIGVAEVENRNVLEDLIRQPERREVIATYITKDPINGESTVRCCMIPNSLLPVRRHWFFPLRSKEIRFTRPVDS